MARGDCGDKSLVRFPKFRCCSVGPILLRGRGSAREFLVKTRISKKMGFLAGAVVVAGISTVSMAEVEYYTVGQFGDPPINANLSVNNNNNVAVASPTVGVDGLYHGSTDFATLTYTFADQATATLRFDNNGLVSQLGIDGVHHLAIDPGQTASNNLGLFSISSTVTQGAETADLAGEAFTLFVYQVDPNSGQVQLDGKLQGSIIAKAPFQAVNSDSPNTPLAVQLSPTFWSLGTDPQVFYSLGTAHDPYPGGVVDITSDVTGSPIQATITVAPLPATASMGLGLFGVIGAAGVLSSLRRRRMAL
jgi:hypothetical protein